MYSWVVNLWRGREADPASGRDVATIAREMLAARRALQAHLPIDLLHDPSLDILLTLFVAQSDGIVLTLRAIATATTVGTATAARWIRAIAQHGLIEDKGSTVRLTGAGHEAVRAAIMATVLPMPMPAAEQVAA